MRSAAADSLIARMGLCFPTHRAKDARWMGARYEMGDPAALIPKCNSRSFDSLLCATVAQDDSAFVVASSVKPLMG